ncbi:MAG: hypothetical protein IOC82_01955 [Aestuariivirga sp.]|uniref:hypothetical protein n=1 Tax=Aestuariivirga sp. TaxID=2650926 RepID=UPI0025B7BA47|nr:hypothetical protein [Aestuariivirga sp.]MCA3559779.1 hypothetical protein [Aestuariivirga sp.]
MALQSPTAKLYSFDEYRKTRVPEDTSSVRAGAKVVWQEQGNYSEFKSQQEASVQDVYPEMSSADPKLYRGLSDLAILKENVEDAFLHFDRGDVLASDDLIGRVLMDLPRIFAVVSDYPALSQLCTSIFHGLRSKRGAPLQRIELEALRKALLKATQEPFMKHSDVLDIQESLDDAGFEIVPDLISPLVDREEDESVY